MKVRTKNPESGVALFFSLFALLLLTAIGAAMIFMAGTETTINSNYRQEQVAYFAAKAGVEEARARMMQSDPSTMYVQGDLTHPLLDTTLVAAPSTLNHMIYYIVNNGNVANAVQPWSSTNAYADDQLCNDGYAGLNLTSTSPGIRCATSNLPNGSYVSYNSTLPFSGTSGAISYKWVRIAPKVNNSVTYLTGSGTSATLKNYSVNSGSSATSIICWDGQEELVLNQTNCSLMKNAAGAPMTNVYLVTAMGVGGSNSNARKVVQSEAALQPTPPFIYGLYATSNACPALNFVGNNPTTDSYTTANGGTYTTTKVNTGGDVGANGGVSAGNGNIGGIVGVLQAPPGNGNCATPFTLGPNGTCENQGSVTCSTTCPSGVAASCYIPQPYVFPTPPAPNPLPPNTPYSPPSCGGKKGGQCMVPGSYGNISITGTLTIAPGTYNINSLSMTGNAQIIVNPPGAVTFNMGGNGIVAPTDVLQIGGNGITDDTIPNDFTINYAGTLPIGIAGNGNVTAMLNAPNAPIAQQGNGNWYGSILGSTIQIGGNGFFHFDRNAALSPNNNGYFTMLSYREIEY